MNWIQFVQLLKMIYGKQQIDLDKIQSWGLLATKIGQVHALRVDFLDYDKCLELSKLYRKTNPIPSEILLSHIDRTKFLEFNEIPIASASIGQVYKAKLLNKRNVAVKIIKSNFKRDFILDVRSIRKFLSFSIMAYPKLQRVFDPKGILHHIEEYTLRELNLLNEIQGHDILEEIANNADYNLSKLKFATIYKELCNENIMISEFIQGMTFDELLEKKELPYTALLELFNIHGYFMFKVGTFHGDIHPGNVMLHKGKIYFIDTGAIGYASEKIRRGLYRFFESLCIYDYMKCTQHLNHMSIEPIHGHKLYKFESDFLTLYQDFRGKTVSQISLTRRMMETIKLCVNSGMRFESGMFPMIKSLMFLDGMVLRCNPNAILMEDLRKMMNQFKKVMN
jgi:ubiquinone biosynthesis protein